MPKLRFLFVLRSVNINSFAMSMVESLSVLSLCMFKTVRLLNRSWFILERSHEKTATFELTFFCSFSLRYFCQISFYSCKKWGAKAPPPPSPSLCTVPVIILVINKSDSRCAVVRFCYHSYDCRPNWTPLSSVHYLSNQKSLSFYH